MLLIFTTCDMKQFLWKPGVGYDTAALARLRTHLPRPRAPMGEAWFMSDTRQMFPELADDLANLSCRDLQKPLTEIASGTSSFGPMNEWTAWYHYLLGNLVPRNHECFVDYLLEYLITGFIALYPDDVGAEPYPGFKGDALKTLGLCMMDSSCWEGSEIKLGTILHRSNNNPNRVWCWWDASGDFSASMFFCLKYLPDHLIAGWMQSVLSIPSPHWRAQVLVWLVGAKEILAGELEWPSDFPIVAVPSISWAWSHCLRPELLNSERSSPAQRAYFIRPSVIAQVLDVIRQYFTADRFLEWLTSFDQVPYVRDEISHLPKDFETIYVR